MTKNILIPKNWQEYQHYKDRSPPWVKLHRKLLDDRDFMSLPLASKGLAPMLWLLASEHKDGHFNGSLQELAFRLRINEKEISAALKPLLDKGLFYYASAALADCTQMHTVAVPETETETETETEYTSSVDDLAPDKSGTVAPMCPHEKIKSLYNEILPELPQVKIMTDARKKSLLARWRQAADFQNTEWWAKYFEHVRGSDFLMGRAKDWSADFDFLIAPKTFTRTLEGVYHRESAS